MTTLVLGASGFLGAWTVRALLARGETVVGLVRSPAPWRLAGVDGATVIDAPETEWPSVVRSVAAEQVVSLDWAGVSGPERDGDAQWRNVERQGSVTAAAIAGGARRIVGVGSQAEYGAHDGLIGEDLPLQPTTEYGRAKVAASVQLRELCGEASVEWVWARVFSAYGPLDHEGTVLAAIARAAAGGTVLELSSGEQPWSYLYASDAAAALATLAAGTSLVGAVNVGHPDAPRLRESLEMFARSLHSESTLAFGSRTGYGLEPDASRLLSTGWAPAVGLANGLALTARWLTGQSVPDSLRAGCDLPSIRSQS